MPDGTNPADDDRTRLSSAPIDEPNPASASTGENNDATQLHSSDDDATLLNPAHNSAADTKSEEAATVLVTPSTQEQAPTEIATPSAATSSTARFLAEDDRETADLTIGTILKDRFVIEEILGRGGMGVVYKALDLRKQEAHDRAPYVALKALSDSYQRDEMMVMALQRESQKAQTLAHPNIATVYDFDREGSLVYLTMEVLTGSPMDDFIRDHPTGLPGSRVAPIVRGMCLGLAYAHNKGIVHSDFKPGNVFINKNDNPKVLDFGIARATPATETQSRESSDVTQFDAGELGALTPSYAAKEMFFGADPHPSDDVYALAVTVYQLLTGQHPYQNKPAPQAETEGLKPVPITGIKRREWRAIRHGLAFNRANRQQHAADFLREFEGQSKLKLVAGIAIFLGLAFSGYFGFVQLQEQARIAPEIAFEDLNGELQSKVTEYLNDGKGLEMFKDYAGALSQYRSAYDLHPRNPDATAAIVELMEKLSVVTTQSADPASKSRLLQNLNDLMATDGFLGNHERLTAVLEELESQ